MSKNEFVRKAGLLDVTVAKTAVAANPKTFSTGSVGWNFNGKVMVTLPDGTEVRVQITGNAVVVGSKEWRL